MPRVFSVHSSDTFARIYRITFYREFPYDFLESFLYDGFLLMPVSSFSRVAKKLRLSGCLSLGAAYHRLHHPKFHVISVVIGEVSIVSVTV